MKSLDFLINAACWSAGAVCVAVAAVFIGCSVICVYKYAKGDGGKK